MSEIKQADAVSTDFVEILKTVRKGACVFEGAQALEKLVALVRERKKPGRLVLELRVEPLRSGEVDTLVVTDEITVKEPKRPAKRETVFYSTERNTLVRHDPRQKEFDSMKLED
jgi:hypothetical protein